MREFEHRSAARRLLVLRRRASHAGRSRRSSTRRPLQDTVPFKTAGARLGDGTWHDAAEGRVDPKPVSNLLPRRARRRSRFSTSYSTMGVSRAVGFGTSAQRRHFANGIAPRWRLGTRAADRSVAVTANVRAPERSATCASRRLETRKRGARLPAHELRRVSWPKVAAVRVELKLATRRGHG